MFQLGDMDQILFSAAKQLEQQLDSEIDRLDNLGTDDLEAIRERRIKEMKLRQEKLIKWKQNVRTRKQKKSMKQSIAFFNCILGTRRIFRVGGRERVL